MLVVMDASETNSFVRSTTLLPAFFNALPAFFRINIFERVLHLASGIRNLFADFIAGISNLGPRFGVGHDPDKTESEEHAQ